ncbi:hypothetical protein CCAX7_18720 [Capsulimonas corticalis]|uniref:Uncharacterized protein n=1 Tax=Capsulimonas corticalis TaxID=2219043 RepID=A0A402D5S0_9BACT|nr:hypothetical protein [Capsulimonas corticalis]BDI29821.1 hypothetical protein CCAX7_18720 [Capsulimonas corticalis]
MDELYHFGYPGRAPEDLRRIAERLDATVVDIRYSALMATESRWRGAALRELLGDRYVRCIALADHAGCEARLGSISVIDFQIGVEFLRQIDGPMILLCGCRDSRRSHRAAVAQRLWTEHRWDSRELDWEDEPMFLSRTEEPYSVLRKCELAHHC